MRESTASQAILDEARAEGEIKGRAEGLTWGKSKKHGNCYFVWDGNGLGHRRLQWK